MGDAETTYDTCLYAPTARSVSRARVRTAELVEKWGHPEVAGDAGLLVSELATNAVRYGRVAGRLFRVEVRLADDVLRVGVTDARGERRPQVPEAVSDDDESGRGLLIVAAVAARWAVVPLDVGKTVWAELDLTPLGRGQG
ncbi:ATP-binding protein [Streptomyces sp. NPDC008317]|uniref:ATP-binding protein n=1 Tax=Streptomyces sp. NPDC008317 TaxID=3364827 RepID=UPI0036E3F996